MSDLKKLTLLEQKYISSFKEAFVFEAETAQPTPSAPAQAGQQGAQPQELPPESKQGVEVIVQLYRKMRESGKSPEEIFAQIEQLATQAGAAEAQVAKEFFNGYKGQKLLEKARNELDKLNEAKEFLKANGYSQNQIQALIAENKFWSVVKRVKSAS